MVPFWLSGREFQSFGAEQENDTSHNEVLDRGTAKLRVLDDLSVLSHVSAVGFSRLDIDRSQ